MNNDEFIYFFHRTTINNSSRIKEIFDNGLICDGGNNMSYTLSKISVNNDLGKKAKEYINMHGGNAVFLIRIPKYYLFPRVLNNQFEQIPLPIWEKIYDFDKRGNKGNICKLSHELIYGVYLPANDAFIPNLRYSPVHNPNGMIYDISQINHMLAEGIQNWPEFARSREKYKFDELKLYDEKNNTWKNAIIQYKKHFDALEVKNTYHF